MRRILSVILLLSLVLSLTPVAMASEAEESCEITCITNMVTGTVPLMCRNVDGSAYILAEYAAIISGYDYRDTEGKPEFITDSRNIIADTYIQDEQNRFWVPIGKTLEQLQAKATATNGCLIVRTKAYTAEELMDRTEAVFNDPEHIDRWGITSVDGVRGNVGVALSTIFNVATQWKLVDAWTGKYTTDNYRKAFALIMAKDKEGENTDLLAALKGTDEILSLLSKLELKSVEADNLEDIIQQFSYGNLTDGEALLSMYETITDPMKAAAEVTGQDADRQPAGLDLGAQLEIFQYLVSVKDASSFYVDMIDNTMFADTLSDPYGWGPEPMIDAAKDLVEYYKSDSFMDLLCETTEKELESLLHGSLNEALDKLSGEMSTALAVERIVIDGISEFLGGEKLSEVMGNVEINYCLAQIQKTAEALYELYAYKAKDPVRAKYAALLYLRCGMVWSYLYEEQVEDADFESYREGIKKHMTAIMEIPDYDLTAEVHNDEISYEHVKAVTKPEQTPVDIPSVNGNTWRNLLTVDGYTYQREIAFHEDGSVEMVSSWLSSEIDEYYAGQYELLEQEEADGGYTFRFVVVGGWATIGENGYSVEDKSYDFLVHMYPPEEDSDTGMTQMYIGCVGDGEHPMFFGDEMALFTFMSDAG